MTIDEILDDLLVREGPGVPPTYQSKNDAGGRTSWGISERAHPEAWQTGPPTYLHARALLEQQYAAPFRILNTVGLDDRLRAALIDDAVMSGVDAAIKRWQFVLGVAMDGVIGPLTLRRAEILNQGDLLKRYVVERAIRITRLVQRRPADLTNLTGWIVRILSFLP